MNTFVLMYAVNYKQFDKANMTISVPLPPTNCVSNYNSNVNNDDYLMPNPVDDN